MLEASTALKGGVFAYGAIVGYPASRYTIELGTLELPLRENVTKHLTPHANAALPFAFLSLSPNSNGNHKLIASFPCHSFPKPAHPSTINPLT